MITAVLIGESGQLHIRRYPTDRSCEARNRFVEEWIAGSIAWENASFHGPNCTVAHPAFTPVFLRKHGCKRKPIIVKQGVTVYDWVCVTEQPSRMEHRVIGFFVRTGELGNTIPPGAQNQEMTEPGPGSTNSSFECDADLMIRLCLRMDHALRNRDERRAYGFMEAARCLAVAVLHPDTSKDIRRATVGIEADMQNGLWESAVRSGQFFTAAVQRAIKKTNERN